MKLPHLLVEMIETADTELAVIPPTLIYNEGWMLRLLLAIAGKGIECFPFSFQRHARWYSEALLYSAFEPRLRGDPIAEAKTHADGVVGQFIFSPGSKTGLALLPDANQLVLLEAKMFAALSKGTRNAPPCRVRFASRRRCGTSTSRRRITGTRSLQSSAR